MNDIVDLAGLPPGVAEALANGTLRDPFSVLGSARNRSGRIVRAFLPGASQVEVVARDGWPRDRTLAPVAPTGLVRRPRSTAREPYRLRIDWPGAVQETEDPYSFGPAAERTGPASVQRRAAFELAFASRRQCR